jgi:hypothetical protein
MSDFLARGGIRRCRLPAGAHHPRPRPRRRRQRHLARQPRARGGARPQDPVLLAARGRPRALPLGRAVDRDRRHARQDDDDVAGRVAADWHGGATRACSSAASRSTSTGELPPGKRARLRHRGRRVRQRVLRQDREVPEVPARHRRRRQHRVRPRRHLPDLDAMLLAFRRFVNLVPRRGLLLLGADSPEALRLAFARSPVETFGFSPPTPTGAYEPPVARSDGRTFSVRRHGTAFGHLRGAAARRAQRAQRAGGAGRRPCRRPVRRDDDAGGLAAVRGGEAAARAAGRRAACPCTTTSRTTRRRSLETLAGARCAWRIPTAHLGVFEPRSATSCRAIFQHDFARGARVGPTRSSGGGVPRVIDEERLAVADLVVADCNSGGRRRAHIPTVPAIVDDRRSRSARGRPRGHHVERRVRRHSRQAARRRWPGRMDGHERSAGRRRLARDRIAAGAPLAPLTTFGWAARPTGSPTSGRSRRTRDARRIGREAGVPSRSWAADRTCSWPTPACRASSCGDAHRHQPAGTRCGARGGGRDDQRPCPLDHRPRARRPRSVGRHAGHGRRRHYGNAHWQRHNIGDRRASGARDERGESRRRKSAGEALAFRLRHAAVPVDAARSSCGQFRVTPGEPSALREAPGVARVSQATQPLALPSAGCVFQNPDPIRDRVPEELRRPPARSWIARASRARRVGGARISESHANFIVNEGGATAADAGS